MSSFANGVANERVNPILVEALIGNTIRKAALATHGTSGPSMADAYVWQHMLVSFNTASDELCSTVADVTQRLATEYVDPTGLLPLLNNCLIPLDKDPGVRPVGIGEVLVCIIGKLVMTVLKKDMLVASHTGLCIPPCWLRGCNPCSVASV